MALPLFNQTRLRYLNVKSQLLSGKHKVEIAQHEIDKIRASCRHEYRNGVCIACEAEESHE